MRITILLFFITTVLYPLKGYTCFPIPVQNTDLILDQQLTAPYDLRDRKSYIQVTNDGNISSSTRIHIQIFQHDRECTELNFFDTLTANDTVVYDLDNLIRNDGSEVPISLLEDSYGYVVISTDTNGVLSAPSLIGNFRIIDDTGYEYRSNAIGNANGCTTDIAVSRRLLNFNTVDGAMYADVIGYAYERENFTSSTVTNIEEGFSFDIFVYDMDEEPLSCDRRTFACGNVMNYGINEDYKNSRGGPLLCPGGGLADPNGGYILFDNRNYPMPPGFVTLGDLVKYGFIGINNGDGTGSMDSWIVHEE